MNPAIETRELCYTYEDGTAALDHVSLRAERGRITGILGANGAGKSTLFLNLNGVLTPQSGEVLLDGAPVRRDRKGLAELRRRVGIVFQDPDDQLFSADVYRDISFGAVNLGLPESEVRRRVEAAMERTGVAHLRDKPTHALSFGQKKRAAIAGVLVMEPEAVSYTHLDVYKRQILKHASAGGAVVGICGGYQMLGQTVSDPDGVEGGGTLAGLGLLPADTVFQGEKTRTRVTGAFRAPEGIFSAMAGVPFEGYEIHMGRTESAAAPLVDFTTQTGERHTCLLYTSRCV